MSFPIVSLSIEIGNSIDDSEIIDIPLTEDQRKEIREVYKKYDKRKVD